MRWNRPVYRLWSYVATLLARWLGILRGYRRGKLPITRPNALALSSASALARKIRQKEVSSREVVQAFIDHIQYVNPMINAVVKTRFVEALREADQADAIIAAGTHNVDEQPFLGVPCTIKECFQLRGMPNASGLVSRLPEHACETENCVTVQRMVDAGFIPLGVTNTSELCMWYESSNRVYGVTKNPYSYDRIVGGSSGGEAAIVAAGGSPIGLGSDIGGSIRMPSFFCGLFGHKSSGGLVPSTGEYPQATGAALNYLCTGPLCTHAEDLMPVLKLLAGPDGRDMSCVRVELKDPKSVDFKKVHFISLENDGGNLLVEMVHPDLIAAQRKVRSMLLDLGAKEISVQLPELKRSFDIWSAMMHESGGPTFSWLMGGGHEINAGLELLKWLFGMSPHTLPGLVLALVEKAPSKFFPKMHEESVRLAASLKEKISDALGENGVLLYPSHPVPAPYHHRPLLTLFNFAYTAVINIMELPSTQCPLGLNAEGVPLGVQVVANHGQDHLSIRVALEIERKFHGWVPPWKSPLLQ